MEKIRQNYCDKIENDFAVFPICGLLGARQVGKTTIARQYARQLVNTPVHYFDLEDYTDLAKLTNPKLMLEPLTGLIIIDEIQRKPDLFPFLRVCADRPHKPARFLILGSASKELLQQSSESLAGRIGYTYVSPFGLNELANQNLLWTQGGFPKAAFHKAEESMRWRKAYLHTYFEKDLRDIGVNIAPQRIHKLWHLLCQYHGQVVNYTAMARFLDVSVPTIKNYLALMEGTFLIRTLTPWYNNAGKRIVKSPKLYIRDSGLRHAMLDISTYEQLLGNRDVGASWEGFALEEITRALDIDPYQCHFWATQQEVEVDMIVQHKGKKIGFEFKVSDHPHVTKSMHMAYKALGLDHLYVVTPIEQSFPLSETMSVLALKDVVKL